MVSIFKKIVFGLITISVVVLLGILGFNVWLNYNNSLINRQKLDLKYGIESERKKRLADEEARREREEQLQQAQLDKAFFNPEGKASILSHKSTHHLGVRKMNGSNLVCGTENAPTLIFSEKVNEYLFNVLRDMTDFRNKAGVLVPDSYNDKNYSPFLKRNNAVMYGAPGTGKTELINELVHHLYQQFHNPKIDQLKKEINELEKMLETDTKKYEQEKNPNIAPNDDPQW
jgi:Cdc6-like AAA superfamily ATPase